VANDSDDLEEAKELFRLCEEAEAENRAAALDDLRFARLNEQWDPALRRKREESGRPCLTINKLPSFIRQVVNDARQNKLSIRVNPVDSAGDIRTADVLSGLIRNIEQVSGADVAYDTAAESAISCGFGYFRIMVAYTHDDSFDQEILIQRVANPFSVYGDPYSTAADSSDWDIAFVTELVPRSVFERRYMDAEPVDWQGGAYSDLQLPWMDGEQILIAECWQRTEAMRKVLLLSSGEVVAEDAYANSKPLFDALGIAVRGERDVRSHRVTQKLLTGAEILERNDWAGRYIPIVPVYGEEVNENGRRHFRSLIRDAKDAQRLFNYFRSTAAELTAMQPKAPFIGPELAFSGDDAMKWDNANVENYSFISYKGNVAPERQAYAGVPAGEIQQALSANDDMQAIIGLHQASLGQPSNEASGVAIMNRQREGDVSTFHFIDNLARAIKHGARIIVDLIPAVYTGRRMVRVLGTEGEAQNVQLAPRPLSPPLGEAPAAPAAGAPLEGPSGANGVAAGLTGPMTAPSPLSSAPGPAPVGAEGVYDPSVGRYDVVVDAGPSFTTRRAEAAEQMMELLRAFPQAAPYVGDLLAKNLDWPGAQEIADRLRALVAPQSQAEPAQDPRLPGMQAEIAKLTAMLEDTSQKLHAARASQAADLARIEVDLKKVALDERRLNVEMYKAETDRLTAQTQASKAAAGAAPMPMETPPV
jgi:hypothetical protein